MACLMILEKTLEGSESNQNTKKYCHKLSAVINAMQRVRFKIKMRKRGKKDMCPILMDLFMGNGTLQKGLNRRSSLYIRSKMGMDKF